MVKNYNVKKQCEFCKEEFWTSYLKKHISRCKVKKHIESNPASNNNLNNGIANVEETRKLTLENEKLKNYVKDTYQNSKALYEIYVVGIERTSIEEKVNQLLISEATKEGYLIELKLFLKWLNKEKRPFSLNSGNLYLSKLKCRPSTLKHKQTILQRIFKMELGESAVLNKVRLNVTYKPKYSLTESETKKFLEETKMKSFEYYLISKVMLTFALRINSIAQLKTSHAKFLTNSLNKELIIPDSKTKNSMIRTVEVSRDLIQEIKKHVSESKSNLRINPYLFYTEGNDLPIAKRKSFIMTQINKLLKSSQAFNHNENYVYSSHMFRKTVANTSYQQGLQKLKSDIRLSLNHAPNTGSIDHYIDQ
jgi:hypothetical protein